MLEKNKATLEQGNAAVAAGDNEGLLSLCTDDTEWTFVGDMTLHGKEVVRRYMAATYIEPPLFTVTQLIGESDFVTALGDITLQGEDGSAVHHLYCDVWRFHGDKIAGLQAFVTKTKGRNETGSAA